MLNDDDFDIDEEFLKEAFKSNYTSTSAGSTKENAKRLSDESLVESSITVKKSKDSYLSSDAPTGAKDSQDIAVAEAEFYASEDFSQYQEAPRPDKDFNLCTVLDNLGTSNITSPSFKQWHDVPKSISANEQSNSTRDFGHQSKSCSIRKFPGPAGILPKLNNSTVGSDPHEPDRKIPTNIQIAPLTNSQSQPDPLSSNAWQEAMKVFQVQSGNESCPLGRFTLAWVRQRAAARRLPQHKVPFLLVALKTLDSGTKDPSVTLQDLSGEMRGILHHELWAEYCMQLMTGSVLALRHVGVISTGPFSRHQCLNITENNVIAIFTPTNSQGDTLKVDVKSVSREQLLKEINTCFSPSSIIPQTSGLFPTVKTGKFPSWTPKSTPNLSRSRSNSTVTSSPCSKPMSSPLSRNNEITKFKNFLQKQPNVSDGCSTMPSARKIDQLDSSTVIMSINNFPLIPESKLLSSKLNSISRDLKSSHTNVNTTEPNMSRTSNLSRSFNMGSNKPPSDNVKNANIFTPKSSNIRSQYSEISISKSTTNNKFFAPKIPSVCSQITSDVSQCVRGSSNPENLPIVGRNTNMERSTGSFTPKRSQGSQITLKELQETSINITAPGTICVSKPPTRNDPACVFPPVTTTPIFCKTNNISVPSDVNSLLDGLDPDALFGDF